jgi:hypothetical protein
VGVVASVCRSVVVGIGNVVVVVVVVAVPGWW